MPSADLDRLVAINLLQHEAPIPEECSPCDTGGMPAGKGRERPAAYGAAWIGSAPEEAEA